MTIADEDADYNRYSKMLYGGDGEDSCIVDVSDYGVDGSYGNSPYGNAGNTYVYQNDDYQSLKTYDAGGCQSGITADNGCENTDGVKNLTACVPYYGLPKCETIVVSGTFYGSGGECAGTYERKLNRDGYPKVCDDYTNIPVYKCQDCESSCTIHYSDGEGFWYVGGSGCSSDSGVMRAFTDYPSDPSRVDTYGWNEWRSDWGQYGGNVDIRVTCDEWPED